MSSSILKIEHIENHLYTIIFRSKMVKWCIVAHRRVMTHLVFFHYGQKKHPNLGVQITSTCNKNSTDRSVPIPAFQDHNFCRKRFNIGPRTKRACFKLRQFEPKYL